MNAKQKQEAVLKELNRIPKWWKIDMLNGYFDFSIKRVVTTLEKEGLVVTRNITGEKQVRINT